MSFTSKDSDNADGFWVVVNDGPQPYHQAQGHLAILYSDLTDVWAYQYTGMAGVRGVNSAFEGTQLDSWENVVQSSSDGAGKTTYSMSLDVSVLNNLNVPTDNGVTWEGVKFDEMIGTWLHTTQNTFAGCTGPYEVNGNLKCFSGSDWLGWDESMRTTTVVPLPAGLPLMLAGLGAFGLARRFKKA
ncbi:MAG: VPLPA-CTERM sorting domain-containing protein [Litoreibacter sp.]|nr:VPLPA-CTERM sorting domain-containing protein [Litoreibacter sp.]